MPWHGMDQTLRICGWRTPSQTTLNYGGIGDRSRPCTVRDSNSRAWAVRTVFAIPRQADSPEALNPKPRTLNLKP